MKKKSRYLSRRLPKTIVSLNQFKEKLIAIAPKVGCEKNHSKSNYLIEAVIRSTMYGKFIFQGYMAGLGWSSDYSSVDEVVNHFLNLRKNESNYFIEDCVIN